MTQQEFQNRFIYNPTTDRLGKGGFGEVFKAYDTYRDRWVAVKMAKVETDHESVRLSKEVELVNKLPAHPNIAYYEECFTFSSFAGEYDFGILQYYEAGNLQQLIERNNLTFAQKQSLLTQLLEGIGFLHEQGIIHRDLKPANILIVKRGDEYIPKITDFGISKKLDINNSSIFSNSLAGAGTLSFSSPEQLGSTTIRKNTDLWSFGVIAYWLLAGELPFNTGIHGTTSEAGRAELFSQIAKGTLPQGIAAINQPWRKMIVACLETNSERRVRNVDECKGILSGSHSSQQDKTQLVTNSQSEAKKSTANEQTHNQKNETKEKQASSTHKSRTTFLISLYAVSVVFALIACFIGESEGYSYNDDWSEAVDSVVVEEVVVDPDQYIYIENLYTIKLTESFTKGENEGYFDIFYSSSYIGFGCNVRSVTDYAFLYSSAKELLLAEKMNSNSENVESVKLDNGLSAYRLFDNFTDDGVEQFVLHTALKVGKNYVYYVTWCNMEYKESLYDDMISIHNSLTVL